MKIENLGPISVFKGELRELNIIIGENISGKTFICEAISLMKLHINAIINSPQTGKIVNRVLSKLLNNPEYSNLVQKLDNAFDKGELIDAPNDLIQLILDTISSLGLDRKKIIFLRFISDFFGDSLKQIIHKNEKFASIESKSEYFHSTIKFSENEFIPELILYSKAIKRIKINFDRGIRVSYLIKIIEKRDLKENVQKKIIDLI